MRIAGSIVALLLLTGLAGCDSINRFAGPPSKTDVPAHLPSYQKPGTPIAVCYNKDTATMETLAAAAQELCSEPGSTVEYLTGDLHINECPLLKKRRAVFICREPRLAPLPRTLR
jgi:hypothetical protein